MYDAIVTTFAALTVFVKGRCQSVRVPFAQAALAVLCPRRSHCRFVERGAQTVACAQHVVAPYGVRPRPRGPVAMPIEWDELSDPRLKPDRWTVRTAAKRVEDQGDAWRGIGRRARKLPATPAP